MIDEERIIDKLQEDVETCNVEMKHAKNLTSWQNTEQLPVNHCQDIANDEMTLQTKETQKDSTNLHTKVKVLQQEGTKKRERFVRESSKLTQRPNCNISIIQKNCKEVSYEN